MPSRTFAGSIKIVVYAKDGVSFVKPLPTKNTIEITSRTILIVLSPAMPV